VLRILREEMERTMTLMGLSGVAAIDRGCVLRAARVALA
jgi:isopentenyl diphosphate isomerase/L-lactate dehydrogenase-like FMN-dependent dehydrogenase